MFGHRNEARSALNTMQFSVSKSLRSLEADYLGVVERLKESRKKCVHLADLDHQIRSLLFLVRDFSRRACVCFVPVYFFVCMCVCVYMCMYMCVSVCML